MLADFSAKSYRVRDAVKPLATPAAEKPVAVPLAFNPASAPAAEFTSTMIPSDWLLLLLDELLALLSELLSLLADELLLD